MKEFLILWVLGSLLALGLWIYMVSVNREELSRKGYNYIKGVADILLVSITSWLSIPFILTMIYFFKEKPSPKWLTDVMVYLSLGYLWLGDVFKAFKRGKIYKNSSCGIK